MPKRTDNAQFQPSPQGGRGWLNRQIEPGEGVWAMPLQSASTHLQDSGAHHCSRNGSHRIPVLRETTFLRHQLHANAALRPLPRLSVPQGTGNQRYSFRSGPVAEISPPRNSGYAIAAIASSRRQSNCFAASVSDPSDNAFAPRVPLTRSLRDHPLPRGGEGQVARMLS